LVLAVVGALTYGATSAFGLVLCAEWLRDPDRPPPLRQWDWIGLILAVPGTAYFLLLSVGLFTYSPGGTSFTPLITGYWVGFGVWLLVRSRTRWRELGRQSESLTGPRISGTADGG
jgi:hypothetical protein